jgi:membrane-bound lytic murein transglycosylase D
LSQKPNRLWLPLAVALLQACASKELPSELPAAQASVPVVAAAPSIPAAPPPVSSAAPPPTAPPTDPLDATRLPPFEGEQRIMQDRLRNLAKVDRTVAPTDLWQRIRNGFTVPDLDSALVREQTNYYVARPEYLQRILNRSRLYLYHIVEEIEKRGLPTELALLPMVESAFNPMAYSRAHASGIWQFIPGTGKRYELEQNWWYDGRRDIVASTTAALDYLSYIYEMHGDWQLALASYNWGENAVARAIAKNRAAGLPTDYANLTMPAETRNYIPKLQALKNIVANPEPFGIKLEPIPNEPYFGTTDSKARDIDVRLAAKLAEMPVEEFIALNPGFSRPLIRAAVTPRIVLPADKIDVFHDNLSKLGERSLVSWKSYQPRKGDTFESIAKKVGMTVGQLREVNGIGPRVKAVPSLLVVPVSGAEATLGKLPIMYAPPIPVAVRRIFHTVKLGETAAAIARRYRVSVEDLKRWNPLSRFTAGQKIAVEVRAPVRAKRPPAKTKTKPAKKSSR